MNTLSCFRWFAIVFLLPITALHAELQPGNTFPQLKVQDQHEADYALEPGTQYVLVSFDMSTGKAANNFLQKQGAEYLPSHHAAFLSNIFGMPWIGRQFALPKMRKYPHRILLADEEHLLDHFPQQPDKVTVFELDDKLTIVSINFWNPRSGDDPLAE